MKTNVHSQYFYIVTKKNPEKQKYHFFNKSIQFLEHQISEDNLTLKIEVMAAENSVLLLQE